MRRCCVGGRGGRSRSPGIEVGREGEGGGGGRGRKTGPCTGAEWIRIPVSLRCRYPRIGSMPKLKSSIANLSPCLTDILVFFTHLPCIPLTTMME